MLPFGSHPGRGRQLRIWKPQSRATNRERIRETLKTSQALFLYISENPLTTKLHKVGHLWKQSCTCRKARQIPRSPQRSKQPGTAVKSLGLIARALGTGNKRSLLRIGNYVSGVQVNTTFKIRDPSFLNWEVNMKMVSKGLITRSAVLGQNKSPYALGHCILLLGW